MKIQHTWKTRTIFILLLLLAAGLQFAWARLLAAFGMEQSSPMGILLVLFPGSLAWCLPFKYVSLLPRAN